jgi:hypothetical protein
MKGNIMSHISTYKHRIKDLPAFEKTCKKLQQEGVTFHYIKEGERVQMYGRQTQSGVAVLQLHDWKYPLVIDDQGKIHYDNFGAKITSMQTFGRVIQKYNETVILDAIDWTEYDSIENTVDEYGNVNIELVNF